MTLNLAENSRSFYERCLRWWSRSSRRTSDDPERRDRTESVDAYLLRLRAALQGLPDSEVEEIVREIRSHIVERQEDEVHETLSVSCKF